MASTPVPSIENFEDLLRASEPRSSEHTAIGVFHAPKTVNLQDRFVFVIAGPEAAVLTEHMATWINALCAQVAQRKAVNG